MAYSKNDLLILALDAAVQAGKVILEVYNQNFDVEYKEDNSPLTLADQKSNDVITKMLSVTQIPLLSEEGKSIEFNDRKHWQTAWVVDPLDGTKEFIKRNGEFTVNIALIENGVPVLGVIYAPVLGEAFYAIKGQGAHHSIYQFNEGIPSVKSSKKLTPHSPQNNLVRVVASRSHMSDETQTYIKEIEQSGKQVQLVSKGSALKFGLIATNQADVYPRFAPTMEWDTAAGQVIVEEVGKKLIDHSTKAPMVYNREQLRNNWFLVE
jgi:3'(2'), 5'-bisphosphate nucleotidase